MILEVEKLKYPLVLDGGLSNVLEEKGCNLNQSLWSAEMLLHGTHEVLETHLDYLRAGADIITTCSYQVSFQGFENRGLNREQTEKALRISVQLAEKAREKYTAESNSDRRLFIAASLGPYGAYLADGSEYTGAYDVSAIELENFHRDRLKVIEDTGADFIALETIPNTEEVLVLSKLLDDVQKPCWLSFSCKDGRTLRDGSELKPLVSALRSHPKVFALGANCTQPSNIPEIIQLIREVAPEKKVIVYPNSGQSYSAEDKSWHGKSDQLDFARMANNWVRQGASIVGGCCRTGPQHISGIRELLR